MHSARSREGLDWLLECLAIGARHWGAWFVASLLMAVPLGLEVCLPVIGGLLAPLLMMWIVGLMMRLGQSLETTGQAAVRRILRQTVGDSGRLLLIGLAEVCFAAVLGFTWTLLGGDALPQAIQGAVLGAAGILLVAGFLCAPGQVALGGVGSGQAIRDSWTALRLNWRPIGCFALVAACLTAALMALPWGISFIAHAVGGAADNLVFALLFVMPLLMVVVGPFAFAGQYVIYRRIFAPPPAV